MARSEHLPIYKASYDLCLYLDQIVRNFSRYHKYAIGTHLREGALRVLRLVVRANSRVDKLPVLLRLREELEELKVLLRLCHDANGGKGDRHICAKAPFGPPAAAKVPVPVAVRAATAQLRSVLASYGGHLRHGAAFGVWQSAWQRAWLRLLFRRDGWRAVERWPLLRRLPRRRFASQYRRLLRHAGDDVLVFCHVGKFVELYGPQRLAALRRLPLAVIHRPRAGFGYAVGFPLALAVVFEKRALASGAAVVHVGESGEAVGGGCAPRRVMRMVLPALA